MTAGRSFPWAVLARALAVQGSWNYETLTGTGFGFVILPALRRIHDRPEDLEAAIRRHEGPFNSHPYLAPLALGAVIRMEEDGEDPDVIQRFKAALRGSLGTLGDQLVWTGWRPVCVLCALAMILLGVPWWVAILAFLLLYHAGHIGLMVWGLSVGLREGRRVAERLRGSALRRSQPRLMTFGTFLAGLVIALIMLEGLPATGVEPGWVWLGVAAAGAAIGAVWGERARRVGVAAAVVLTLVGLIAGVAA
ncbi:MAG: PTS system mannose/fructose/sorbose family transporter subunit IID [Gemmatimonadota bacterium]